MKITPVHKLRVGDMLPVPHQCEEMSASEIAEWQDGARMGWEPDSLYRVEIVEPARAGWVRIVATSTLEGVTWERTYNEYAAMIVWRSPGA